TLGVAADHLAEAAAGRTGSVNRHRRIVQSGGRVLRAGNVVRRCGRRRETKPNTARRPGETGRAASRIPCHCRLRNIIRRRKKWKWSGSLNKFRIIAKVIRRNYWLGNAKLHLATA